MQIEKLKSAKGKEKKKEINKNTSPAIIAEVAGLFILQIASFRFFYYYLFIYLL